LNPDGSPVEFVFSSNDNTLRYTVEVAGAEHPEHTRLDLACRAMRHLGFTPPPDDFVEVWREVHKKGQPRWGAWLGIRRHSVGESAKVYVEVPLDNPLSSELEKNHSPVPGARLVMLGYEPARGRVEYYFRKRQISPSNLDAILSYGYSDAQRAAVIRAIEGACGLSIAAALRWFAPGFSIAQAENGCVPALFLRSSTLGGGPAIRRYLCSPERCCPGFAFYRDLVESLADAELPEPGMLTFSAAHSGEVEVRLGMSGATVAGAWEKRRIAALESKAPTTILRDGFEAPACPMKGNAQVAAVGM
jgi:hypothetical protein